MAKEYILIKEADLGIIALNKSVFESIVYISQEEISEVVSKPTTRFKKPISVKLDKNRLHLFVDVTLKFGSNVNLVCKKLQNKIYDSIYQMTNIRAEEITLNIIGFEK